MEEKLLKLYQEGKLEELLSLIEKREDFESIIFKAEIYNCLERYDDTLNLLIPLNEELFKEYPLKVIDFAMEALFAVEDFDQAYELADKLEEMPYISQRVEERVKGLYLEIRRSEVKNAKKYAPDPETIHEAFHCTDNTIKNMIRIMSFMNDITKLGPEDYRDDLRFIAEGDLNQAIKVGAVIVLSAIGDKKPLFYKNGNKTFSVIPAEVDIGKNNENLGSLIKAINQFTKNTTLNQVAIELASELENALFPEKINFFEAPNIVLPALFLLAAEHLQSDDGNIILSQYDEPTKKLILTQEKIYQNALDNILPLNY